MRSIFPEAIRNSTLAGLPTTCPRFIYVSSTGVYGQSSGEWVDEASECRPQREGGRACLEAEQLLRSDPVWGSRAIILRLAGIYGPGRIPKLKSIRAGEPLKVDGDGFINLIHVEDAADIVLLAEHKAQPPREFIVSDGCPVRRADFYGELARLIGCDPPRFGPAGDKAPPSRRGAGDKRVRNERLVSELGATFNYPSYREGLAAICGGEE